MNDTTPAQVPKDSRCLFHYTTAEGLLGIIKDNCLFATHADFSNDSAECKLIRPHLKKVLMEEFKHLVPKLIELGILKPELLEEYGRSFYAAEAENCVNVMLKAVGNVSPYFITSFCVHQKSDYEYFHGLLSQWRGYARG